MLGMSSKASDSAAAARVLLPAWQTLFFVVPLLFLIVGSLGHLQNYELNYFPPTLDNYREVLSESIFWESLVYTARISFITATLSTFITFVVSPAVVWGFERKKIPYILVFFVVPLVVGYPIRLHGWHQMLLENGAVNSLLRSIGIIGDRESISYTREALVLVYISQYVSPIMIYPILRLMEINTSSVLAARNLGASRIQVVLDFVVKPMAVPLLVVFLVVFFLCFGDSLAFSVVGGNSGLMLPVYLDSQYQVNAWPNAMVISTIMALLVGVPVLITLAWVFNKLDSA